MQIIRVLTVVATAALITGPTSAQSLLDKVKKGLGKGADAVEGTLKSVDDSLDSTAVLVSDEETPQQTRDRLDATTEIVLDRLFAENEDAQVLFELSEGYAVFDTRQATVVVIAAGYGRGVATSNITGQKTYMNMATGGLGFSVGLGGFERQIVILFEDEAKFNSFVLNGYDATAEAGTMFGDEKTDQTVRFIDGRSIFVLTKIGWKVSASAAGTKYWTDPNLN